VQQFRANAGIGFVTATMAAAGCSMQFVLPNRTPLPATREAGSVQIAIALIQKPIGNGKAARSSECQCPGITVSRVFDLKRPQAADRPR